MRNRNKLMTGGLGAFAMCVLAFSGCQTHMAGLTLPSPSYLKHYPSYFPEDPAFPLQRERDSMIDPTGEIRRGVAPSATGALPQAPTGVAAPMPAMGPGN